jgi:hypothetical protein
MFYYCSLKHVSLASRLHSPTIVGLFTRLLPPRLGNVPGAQKVESLAFILQNTLLLQLVNQLLFEFTQRGSLLGTNQSSVPTAAGIQQRLVMSGIGTKETALEVDQKGRRRRGPSVLSRAEIVRGLDQAQEPIVQIFAGKGGCTQISSQNVQFPVRTYVHTHTNTNKDVRERNKSESESEDNIKV